MLSFNFATGGVSVDTTQLKEECWPLPGYEHVCISYREVGSSEYKTDSTRFSYQAAELEAPAGVNIDDNFAITVCHGSCVAKGNQGYQGYQGHQG